MPDTLLNSGDASMEAPIACSLTAFTAEQRKRYDIVKKTVLFGFEKVEKSESAVRLFYAYRSQTLMNIAEWTSLESICCPFWRFSINFEAQGDTICLTLSGPEGAIPILEAAMNGAGCNTCP